jgi:hypothetical protein
MIILKLTETCLVDLLVRGQTMSYINVKIRTISVIAIVSLIVVALSGATGCQSPKTTAISNEKGPRILFFSSDT